MKNKKILIIRFHAIGDLVLSTVIPQSIKQKHPNCEVHYFTSLMGETILKNCPYVDKIMTFKGSMTEAIEQFKVEKYDAIISLNYTLRNFSLAFKSFPKKIIFKSSKGKSWVDNYFNTAKGVYSDIELPKRLCLVNSDKQTEASVAEKLSNYPKPHIFISPGRPENNPRQGRAWNIDKWKKLSQSLLEKYGGTVFVTGSSEERDYHMALEGDNVVILSGLLDLPEGFAALSMADLIITCDSGPAHIGAAYGVKTLALLGSTSPDKIKPYGENGYFIEPQIKCKYCWKKKCKKISSPLEYTPCLESITPEIVMEKISNCSLL